jgi:hypothetical protein
MRRAVAEEGDGREVVGAEASDLLADVLPHCQVHVLRPLSLQGRGVRDLSHPRFDVTNASSSAGRSLCLRGQLREAWASVNDAF